MCYNCFYPNKFNIRSMEFYNVVFLFKFDCCVKVIAFVVFSLFILIRLPVASEKIGMRLVLYSSIHSISASLAFRVWLKSISA